MTGTVSGSFTVKFLMLLQVLDIVRRAVLKFSLSQNYIEL